MNSTAWESKDGFNEAEFEMSVFMKYMNAQANGNYDPNNLAMAQHYVLGQAAFMLKKWLPRGGLARYKGIFTPGKKRILADKIDEAAEKGGVYMLEQEEYNEAMQDREIGRYTTAIEFLGSVKARFNEEKMKAFRTVWEELGDDERASMHSNIFGFVTTISFFAMATALASLAEAGGDDDEDKGLFSIWGAAYIMKRAQQELTFWVNPTDFFRMAGSPIIPLAKTSEFFDLVLGSVLNGDAWTDYERGDYKGWNKTLAKAYKFIPYTKMLKSRDYEKSYNYLDNPVI